MSKRSPARTQDSRLGGPVRASAVASLLRYPLMARAIERQGAPCAVWAMQPVR